MQSLTLSYILSLEEVKTIGFIAWAISLLDNSGFLLIRLLRWCCFLLTSVNTWEVSIVIVVGRSHEQGLILFRLSLTVLRECFFVDLSSNIKLWIGRSVCFNKLCPWLVGGLVWYKAVRRVLFRFIISVECFSITCIFVWNATTALPGWLVGYSSLVGDGGHLRPTYYEFLVEVLAGEVNQYGGQERKEEGKRQVSHKQ